MKKKKMVIEEESQKRRTAMIHIPIEDNVIAGEPYLNKDMDERRLSECFGSPVKTCGHLVIRYDGELRRMRWSNKRAGKLTLKRRRGIDTGTIYLNIES